MNPHQVVRQHRQREAVWRQRWVYADKRVASHQFPLLDSDAIVLGPAVDHVEGEVHGPRRSWLTLPERAVDGHMVVVGDTGSGKSTLLRRIASAEVGKRRGTTIVIDCKGGPQAVADGLDWAGHVVASGVDADSVGVWPETTHLNMWDMDAEDLVETLYGMITPSHTHYDTLRESAVRMAVTGGEVPSAAREFLDRLTAGWMRGAWPERSQFGAEAQYLTSSGSRVPAPIHDIRAKYANLFAEMGQALEGGRPLWDFGALWCVVPGTRRPEAAKASANAIVQMVVDALARDKADGGQITLIIDEYSAVSGGVDLSPLVERLRSLGGRVIMAAQSWEGLGPSDGARTRLVAAASGGLLLLRTAHALPFQRFTGTVRRAQVVTTTTEHLEVRDTVGMPEAPLVDPQRVRTMRPGDVVYVRSGVAVWGRVAPMEGSPATGREPSVPNWPVILFLVPRCVLWVAVAIPAAWWLHMLGLYMVGSVGGLAMLVSYAKFTMRRGRDVVAHRGVDYDWAR